jgi:hypothetical protein
MSRHPATAVRDRPDERERRSDRVRERARGGLRVPSSRRAGGPMDRRRDYFSAIKTFMVA